MKKILRLVTTSVLTLTLVACGEGSSSVSTSGTQTSSSVSSPSTSAFANVTTITLTAASDTLTQVLGSLKRVTVSAALNANTNPTLALEWFVDGVKSNQTGRIFEFTPTAVGNFVLQAKVGNVLSNTITVAVGQGGLAVETAKFADADTIELKAPGGATVTVAGHEVADTSYYSLAKGTYVIDLKKAVTQGTQVTVNLTGSDGKSISQQVTYDTREFALSSLKLDGVTLTVGLDGVYKVVRPFDASNLYQKTYTLAFTEKNIIGTTPVTYKVETTVPTGATAVSAATELVSELQSKSYVVDSTTTPGLYTHKITLGTKVLEIKVLVELPVAEIVLDKAYSHAVTGSSTPVKFDFGYTLTDVTPTTSAQKVLPNAAGEYVITKPYLTYGTDLDYIQFKFHARNFDKLDFINNQFNVSVTGPSKFSSEPSLLFSGIETEYSSNGNSTYLTTNLVNKNFDGGIAGFAATTSAAAVVKQAIDSGTPVGTYTFRVSAGYQGKLVTKDVVVKIVAPAAKLDFVLTQYESDQDLYTTGSDATRGLATRKHTTTQLADGTYVIEKPIIEGPTYDLGWYTVLQNYQSHLIGLNDFAEVTTDNLVTNLDNRKLFTNSSGIKKQSGVNHPGANLLVKKGLTKQAIEVEITHGSDATLTVTPTITYASGSSGINAFENDASNTAIAHNTTYDLAVTAGTKKYTIALLSTTDGVATGSKISFALTGGTSPTFLSSSQMASGDQNDFIVQVSDYPDVIELGSATATDDKSYRFVNVAMTSTGPQKLFDDFLTTRTALLLGANKDGLVLFNQTGNLLDLDDVADDFDINLDTNGATQYDVHDLSSDKVGLDRSLLSITNTTVAGLYTLKFTVDNIVKEVKIQIVNPQPKVFVLSGFDLVDNNDSDTLKNNLTPSLNVADVITTGQNAVGGNDFYFSASGAGYNRIQTYDQDGILPNQSGYFPGLSDRFVSPSATTGNYTVFLPTTRVAGRDILFGRIAVADLAKGEYDYLIEKTYPDGRKEVFSDLVKVTSVDSNQVATFDSANTKFISNWIINENSYTKGTYKFKFKIDSYTREFDVVVTDAPFMTIDTVSIGTNKLPSFDGSYTASLSQIVGSASLTFELSTLTTANFYEVTAAARVKQVNAGQGFVAAKAIKATAPVGKLTLKDITKLNLGSIALNPGNTVAIAGEYVDYTVNFFSLNAASGVYSAVGNPSRFSIMVNDNPTLARPLFTVSTDGKTVEGREVGEVLTLRVQNASFNLDKTPAQLQDLIDLAGIAGIADSGTTEFFTVTKVDSSTLLLKLTASASADYANTDQLITVTVSKDALVAPAASEPAFVTSYDARVVFLKTPITVTLGTGLVAGAEDNKTLTIKLTDYKFGTINANASEFTRSGIPAFDNAVKGDDDFTVVLTFSANAANNVADVKGSITIANTILKDLDGNNVTNADMDLVTPEIIIPNAVTISLKTTSAGSGVIAEGLEKDTEIEVNLSQDFTFVADLSTGTPFTFTGLPYSASTTDITFTTTRVSDTKAIIKFTNSSGVAYSGNKTVTLTVEDAALTQTQAADLTETFVMVEKLAASTTAPDPLVEGSEKDKTIDVEITGFVFNANQVRDVTSLVTLVGLPFKTGTTPIGYRAELVDTDDDGVFGKVRITLLENSTVAFAANVVVQVMIDKSIVMDSTTLLPATRNFVTSFTIPT